MADTPKRRLLNILRRTGKRAGGAAESKISGHRAAEESAMWSAHERGLLAAREAGTASARLTSTVAKQRGLADSASDRARGIAARVQEVSAAAARASDVFDRLGLVALNAGLEGARLGETVGRALLLVSDEVRAQTARGLELTRELTSALGEIGAELSQIAAQVAQARETTGDVAQDAARVANLASETEIAFCEIGERLRRTTGSDPETVRAIAAAAENARALVASLTTLSDKVPRALLLGALRPMLEPLARLLDDEGALDDA